MSPKRNNVFEWREGLNSKSNTSQNLWWNNASKVSEIISPNYNIPLSIEKDYIVLVSDVESLLKSNAGNTTKEGAIFTISFRALDLQEKIKWCEFLNEKSNNILEQISEVLHPISKIAVETKNMRSQESQSKKEDMRKEIRTTLGNSFENLDLEKLLDSLKGFRWLLLDMRSNNTTT